MILALDTSSSTGSLALADQGRVIQELEFSGSQRHSSTLFPALETLGLAQLPIERILVGLGPGSFSGIRVSLAAALAIAAIKNATLLGVCSAWSVARQYADAERLGVFADARRGEFYVTRFCKGILDRDTFLIRKDQLATEAAAMTVAVSAEPLAEIPQRAVPRAADFLRLPPDFAGFVPGPHLEPIYLRDPIQPVRIS